MAQAWFLLLTVSYSALLHQVSVLTTLGNHLVLEGNEYFIPLWLLIVFVLFLAVRRNAMNIYPYGLCNYFLLWKVNFQVFWVLRWLQFFIIIISFHRRLFKTSLLHETASDSDLYGPIISKFPHFRRLRIILPPPAPPTPAILLASGRLSAP